MLRRVLLVAPLVALTACGSAPKPEPPPLPAVVPVRAPPRAPEVLLAPTFAGNAGRLPWPAEGTVTGFFGSRRDPATGTVTEAVGIDIATAPEAPILAAFGGRVSRVGQMAAFGTYVMLKHGGWTTVYGNLSRVDVASGDDLAVGDTLGAAGTREDRRGAALFFAVFEHESPVDPLLWLRPRDGSLPPPLAPADDTTPTDGAP